MEHIKPAFCYALLGSCIILAYRVSVKSHKYPRLDHIPAIGFSRFPASYWTLAEFIYRAPQLIQHACLRYTNGAFKVMYPHYWRIILTSYYLDDVGQASDDELSFIEAFSDSLKLAHISAFNLDITRIPYHISVIRTRLSRNFSTLHNDIREEVVLALDEVLGPQNNGAIETTLVIRANVQSAEWISVPALGTVRKIVCRASNRVLVGLPLCRDPDWIDLSVRYPEDLVHEAVILELFPRFMLPLAARLLSSLPGRIAQGIRHLAPIIDRRRKYTGKYTEENKPNDCIQWLLDEGKEYTADLLTQRIFTINFVINHTTPNVFTQALFNLVANPQYIRPLRNEVETIISEEGWTRSALSKLQKVDSFLKETMRLGGMTLTTISRKALKDITLSDGTLIPQNSMVDVHTSVVHHDGSVYKNPETFEPFRFCLVQDSVGGRRKQQMTAVTRDWLAFGYGKHACPGRFFASDLMKTMLAHILLSYDMKLEENSQPPKNVVIGTAIRTDPRAKLMFRRKVV